MSPPQGKKNCAKAPPLGKQIGSISPPPGNNTDCLVHVDLHVIILCLWTKKFEVENRSFTIRIKIGTLRVHVSAKKLDSHFVFS
jgi:hypothetical protein